MQDPLLSLPDDYDYAGLTALGWANARLARAGIASKVILSAPAHLYEGPSSFDYASLIVGDHGVEQVFIHPFAVVAITMAVEALVPSTTTESSQMFESLGWATRRLLRAGITYPTLVIESEAHGEWEASLLDNAGEVMARMARRLRFSCLEERGSRTRPRGVRVRRSLQLPQRVKALKSCSVLARQAAMFMVLSWKK